MLMVCGVWGGLVNWQYVKHYTVICSCHTSACSLFFSSPNYATHSTSPKMTLQYTTILALIKASGRIDSLSGHSHNQLVFGKTVHSRASWCKIQNRKLKMRIDKLAVNLKSVARAVYRFMPCHAMPTSPQPSFISDVFELLFYGKKVL